MKRIFTIMAPCIFLAGMTPALDAQQPENPAPCLAPGVPVQLAYGDHTTGCGLGSPGQLDIFTFFGNANDDIRVVIQGLTKNLDPRLEILDPTGATVATNFCSADQYNVCSFSTALVLPLGGQYTLMITDAGTNNSGSYQLQLEKIPPLIPPPGIEYGPTNYDTVSPATDFDFYSFQANQGTKLQVSVVGTTKNLDPWMGIYNSQGLVLSKSCSANQFNTCSFSTTLDLTQPGSITDTYYALILDSGANNTGNYNLTVTCFFGPCADTAAGLTSDISSITVANGGVQNLSLDAGSSLAGEPYLLLGTTTGFSPGFPIEGEYMPLNIDGPAGYFIYSLGNPNIAPLGNSFGLLDGLGQAQATVTVPAGALSLAGSLTLYHAFAAFETKSSPGIVGLAYISNPVALTLQ